MKKENIKQLKTLLTEWFDSVDLTQRNIFNQNEIASLLKRQLKKANHWKDCPRGSKCITNNIKDWHTNKQKLLDENNKLKSNIVKCKCGEPIEMIESKNGKVNFSCSNILLCPYS